jgi:hypothetical protein
VARLPQGRGNRVGPRAAGEQAEAEALRRLVPSENEKAALRGTSGVPTNSNRYVTDEDVRLEAAADLAIHEAAADPHTGYRLESADHNHQSTGAQAGQLDHGAALTGLADDDHAQYPLLAGRSGGQTLKGGTASGDDLTLQSTEHATKGNINFGASTYDEANNRLGIGDATPSYRLDVDDANAAGSNVAGLWNSNAGDNTNTYMTVGKAFLAHQCAHFGFHYDTDGATSSYAFLQYGGDALSIKFKTGGALEAGGSVKSISPTAGIGYATGAGGTVTQLTDKATGVTLNKVCGEITMHNANLGAATIVSFTLTNSAIAATDVLALNHVTTGTRGAYTLNAQCGAGSAIIYVRNNTAGILGEAIVIRFAVIKGVTS